MGIKHGLEPRPPPDNLFKMGESDFNNISQTFSTATADLSQDDVLSSVLDKFLSVVY